MDSDRCVFEENIKLSVYGADVTVLRASAFLTNRVEKCRRSQDLPRELSRLFRMNRTVTIVMYHYVRDLERSRFPAIKGLSLERFRRQLDHIKANFTPIGVEEVLEAVASPKSELPPNSILLTFDDGYSDHFLNVFPMLDARGTVSYTHLKSIPTEWGCLCVPRQTTCGRGQVAVGRKARCSADAERQITGH